MELTCTQKVCYTVILKSLLLPGQSLLENEQSPEQWPIPVLVYNSPLPEHQKWTKARPRYQLGTWSNFVLTPFSDLYTILRSPGTSVSGAQLSLSRIYIELYVCWKIVVIQWVPE